MDSSCIHESCQDPVWSRSKARGFCYRHYWQDYHSRNRESRLEAQADWRERNPEYWRNKDPEVKRLADEKYRNKPEVKKRRGTASTRYASERRARQRGSKWEPFTDVAMIELWGSDCHLCGEPVDLTAPRQIGKPGWQRGLHREHLVSVKNGGETTLENCRPAHGLCNLRKGSR